MANADLDGLLNMAIHMARQSLSDDGSFSPFCAHISNEGETTLVTAEDPNAEPGAEQLDQLRQVLRDKAQEGGIRAAVLCFAGRATPPGEEGTRDVIGVQLDHISGECYELGVPFSIDDAGEVDLGALFGARVAPELFAAP